MDTHGSVVRMAIADLSTLPKAPMPEGYSTRFYHTGDDRTWAEIQVACGEFENVEAGVRKFWTEFEANELELNKRCLFLVDPSGRDIATATGWFDTDCGRLHWVALLPELHGRGLGRPLVKAACELMRQWHTSAYLVTHTRRFPALRIYLDMGFRPVVENDSSLVYWQEVAREVRHPALEPYRGVMI